MLHDLSRCSSRKLRHSLRWRTIWKLGWRRCTLRAAWLCMVAAAAALAKQEQRNLRWNGDNYSIWRQHSDAMEIVLSRVRPAAHSNYLFLKSCSPIGLPVSLSNLHSMNFVTSRTSQNMTINVMESIELFKFYRALPDLVWINEKYCRLIRFTPSSKSVYYFTVFVPHVRNSIQFYLATVATNNKPSNHYFAIFCLCTIRTKTHGNLNKRQFRGPWSCLDEK